MRWLVAVTCLLASACEPAVIPGRLTGPAPLPPDDYFYFSEPPHGADRLRKHCKEGPPFDFISGKFCDPMSSTPTGLADLQRLLELNFANPAADGANGAGGNPGFVLSGHSSSLVARAVSATNPRAI